MAQSFGKLRQLADMIGKGLIQQAVPGIAQGMINKFFHEWKIDAARITQDVESGRSLWADLKPEQRKQLKVASQRIGSLDFITPALVVDAIKEDFSGIASMFLNWPEAGEWLARQVDELKRNMTDI